MTRFFLKLWSTRWGMLRLALAAFVCWVLAADTASRLARLQLATLPDFDYASEVNALRAQGRYGEAEVIAKAGLDGLSLGPERDELDRTLQQTIAERDSWMRKVRSAGLGALSGRGTDLESLVGAVAADFFVVGDVRDLVLEGGKLLIDGDSDELVLLLSFVGLVTTLAPEIDWAPAVLKAARRTGNVTGPMAAYLSSAIKAKRVGQITEVCESVARISRKASPGGASRLLRLADEPEDLARMAAFVERTPHGAFALHVTDASGMLALRSFTAQADSVIVAVARKGRAGVGLLSSPVGRALMKPHAVVGVVKAVWKGNAEQLVSRAIERLDPNAWWAMPLAAAWAVLEALMIWQRLLTPVEAKKA